MDFSLGISWQYGLLTIISMLLLPFFRGRYAFIVGAIGFSLIDIFAGKVGMWTLSCALVWGLVSFIFAKHQPNGTFLNFAKMSVFSVLVFDILTGIVFSAIFWGMPLTDAAIGQIPFTIKHLLGITAIALICAPLLFPAIAKQINKLELFVLKPQAARA